MNKFIRTKEGRIISYDTNADKIDLPMILNYPNQILKQVDTIEELCDEIVVKENSSSKPKLLGRIVNFDENGNMFYVKGEYSFKGIAYTLKELMEKYKEMSIKGAIWTDGGLIYIAKADKEGELELIWTNL